MSWASRPAVTIRGESAHPPGAPSNAALTRTPRTVHAGTRGTYGVPRVPAELAADGARIGKNRMARRMRAASIAGVSRRRFVVTTVRDANRRAPDLADRRFVAEAPNKLWVADIT